MMVAEPLSSFDTYRSEELSYTHKRCLPYEVKLDLSSCASSFWFSYCSVIEKLKTGEVSVPPSYMEKGSDHTPINITLIFNYDVEDRVEYPSLFIASMVSIVQHTIIEVYEIPAGNRHLVSLERSPLYCVVLYGVDQYTDESGDHCCTLSLRFPRCVVPTSSQTTIFRNKLIDNLRRSNVLNLITIPKNINFSSIICTSPPMGDWALYGSVSSTIKTHYRMEHLLMEIPLEDLQNHADEDDFPIENYDLNIDDFDFFNPALHRDCRRYSFDPLSMHGGYEYWLPLILSIGFCDLRTKVRTDMPNTAIMVSKPPSIDTDVCIAQTLLCMIKARTPDDWIVIGMALYKCWEDPIFKGNVGLKDNLGSHYEQLAKDQWIISLKRHNYEYLAPIWGGITFRQDNVFTLRTIAWMAKQDSPEEYHNWNIAWIASPVKKAVESSKKNDHMTVANAFYRCFWLEYCYVEGQGRSTSKWFHYRHHHWNQICETEMKEPVMRFREHIQQLMGTLTNNMNNSHDQNEKDLINNLIKLSSELYDKFGNISWIDNIIRASKAFFLISNFETLANNNKCLTGVRNGVIEVNEKTAFFRPGRPEDYLTKFTTISYEDLEDSPLLRSYMEYINQVFPDPELADLMLRFFSSLLHAIPSKNFFIWTGDGNNGKSTIVKLLNATLGDDYVVNISPTFITMKRGNSSTATPDIAAMRHTRLVVIQEPDEGEQLKSGKIKEATGGDKIRARALFENGGPIDPTYQIVLQCNEIPEAKKEQAMTNRIIIVPFLSTWVDANLMPEDPEEARTKHLFKKDPTFMANVSKYSPACLYMMVKYFSKFRDNPITGVPKVVTDHTNNYWNKVDVYQRYLHDRIEWVYADRSPADTYIDPKNPFTRNMERDLDLNVFLSQYDLYHDFVSWFRETGRASRIGGEIPIYDKVIEQYSKVLGEPTYLGWPGISLRAHVISGNM